MNKLLSQCNSRTSSSAEDLDEVLFAVFCILACDFWTSLYGQLVPTSGGKPAYAITTHQTSSLGKLFISSGASRETEPSARTLVFPESDPARTFSCRVPGRCCLARIIKRRRRAGARIKMCVRTCEYIPYSDESQPIRGAEAPRVNLYYRLHFQTVSKGERASHECTLIIDLIAMKQL